MRLLELESLQFGIGGRLFCRELTLDLEAGQMLGILGRNGTGKTTLLHTIMGFHKPDGGRLRVCGSDPAAGSRRRLARQVGLLFQESDSSMPATVLETVLLGRHPYSENLLWDSAEDLALAHNMLTLVGLEALAGRQVATLSGGEKQRLAVALLLAQKPALYLLDEPGNHLDIDYQVRILELLTRRIEQDRAALVMASHDINLVSRFCQRVLLFLGDGALLAGPTRDVLTASNLEQAFGCRIIEIAAGQRRYFMPG